MGRLDGGLWGTHCLCEQPHNVHQLVLVPGEQVRKGSVEPAPVNDVMHKVPQGALERLPRTRT